MQIEKHDYILELYDFYSELLTEKQRSYFEGYYFDDLSIGEIAENYGLSRNAIYDQLKKTCEKLLDFESKLKLNLTYKKIEDILDGELKTKILDIIKEWNYGFWFFKW